MKIVRTELMLSQPVLVPEDKWLTAGIRLAMLCPVLWREEVANDRSSFIVSCSFLPSFPLFAPGNSLAGWEMVLVNKVGRATEDEPCTWSDRGECVMLPVLTSRFFVRGHAELPGCLPLKTEGTKMSLVFCKWEKRTLTEGWWSSVPKSLGEKVMRQVFGELLDWRMFIELSVVAFWSFLHCSESKENTLLWSAWRWPGWYVHVVACCLKFHDAGSLPLG